MITSVIWVGQILSHFIVKGLMEINTLWRSAAMWRHKSGSVLEMACCHKIVFKSFISQWVKSLSCLKRCLVLKRPLANIYNAVPMSWRLCVTMNQILRPTNNNPALVQIMFGTEQVISHNLIIWWPILQTHIYTSLRELMLVWCIQEHVLDYEVFMTLRSWTNISCKVELIASIYFLSRKNVHC